MAETELKKGEHLMKTILEKVKKWFASVRSEIPAFCKLCKVTISLIAKTVKKQDASIDKSAFAELRTKMLNAQIAFGGVLVILTAIVFARGCGHNHSTGCVTYADADTRKAVLAQVELEKQRAIKAEVEQKEAEAKRAAEEARRYAADEAKKQKHKELGAWYSAERKKLENQKKAAEAEIERSQYERAHAIRIEKGWPEIGFPGLDGIVLAEPLPEKYSNYAQVECPVTIKDLPMFTSLEIRGVRPCGVNEPAGLRGVVDEIRLNGKTSMTAKQAIEAMQKLSKPPLPEVNARSPCVYPL